MSKLRGWAPWMSAQRVLHAPAPQAVHLAGCLTGLLCRAGRRSRHGAGVGTAGAAPGRWRRPSICLLAAAQRGQPDACLMARKL